MSSELESENIRLRAKLQQAVKLLSENGVLELRNELKDSLKIRDALREELSRVLIQCDILKNQLKISTIENDQLRIKNASQVEYIKQQHQLREEKDKQIRQLQNPFILSKIDEN